MVSPIRLLADGTIYGHSNDNEYSWKIENGELNFLTKDGRVSTKFSSPFLEDNKITFIGDFLLRPNLNIKHKIKQIDFSRETLGEYPANTKKALKDLAGKYKWKIGEHTYGIPKVFEAGMAHLEIGKFCSLASGTNIILGNHNINTATTYPFTSLKKYWPGAIRDNISDHHTNGDIIIGNDVWIGSNATIMSGVKIGDGAVIAANSVVTKSVEPYSIVGGSPAKMLRMRHNASTIEALLKIKWWNWSDEIIDERIKFLLSDVDDFIARFK
ncbi:CatB-related O-acetyltransferase [Escherichia coli]|uniref:CatB-related O-acetyltransferase n=1 Tax=Escherichia coli TaxID=562 RepID=UPI0013B03E21|nr:CatB-related O-acetyltransferase [Escherichia coli]